jgi:hypothetical protein
MSNSGIQVESSNIQNILIALVVICAVIYAFIEFRKINTKIQQLEIDFSKLKNNFVSLLNSDISNNILHKPVDSIKETIKEKNNVVENTITENTITENTEAENNDIVTNNIVENKYTTENEIIMDTIINQVEGELNKPPIMNGLFMSIEKPIHTDNRIEELDENEESKIEESKIEESNIEESNIEESNIEESTIEYTNSEYSYEEYTIRELKEKLTELNLSTSGNKNKLIERIISHENKM